MSKCVRQVVRGRGGGCKGRHEGVYAVYVVRGYVLSEPV